MGRRCPSSEPVKGMSAPETSALVTWAIETQTWVCNAPGSEAAAVDIPAVASENSVCRRNPRFSKRIGRRLWQASSRKRLWPWQPVAPENSVRRRKPRFSKRMGRRLWHQTTTGGRVNSRLFRARDFNQRFSELAKRPRANKGGCGPSIWT